MNKIITVLLTVLFLTNCGYTPIYSNKNFDFNIKDIITSTDNLLNSRIKKRLLSLSNQESSKMISLNLDVQKKINTLSKDTKGDATRFEMVINIQLKITYDHGQNINNFFEETFNYNVNKNKFELSQYEKEIENLLINENINRITIYLSKL
tara:strand:+ start:208 stop:660 length:453 start_codon:yes stop_codon:yes gene_type:complete